MKSDTERKTSDSYLSNAMPLALVVAVAVGDVDLREFEDHPLSVRGRDEEGAATPRLALAAGGGDIMLI